MPSTTVCEVLVGGIGSILYHAGAKTFHFTEDNFHDHASLEGSCIDDPALQASYVFLANLVNKSIKVKNAFQTEEVGFVEEAFFLQSTKFRSMTRGQEELQKPNRWFHSSVVSFAVDVGGRLPVNYHPHHNLGF
ncbi:hypothetical protein CDAR_61571 [Caerostris darwini]|uniref:Uncharacterized protein n=1 Tax=Caerostris darwini TaxID=1538125 RepID=A0AAV4R2G1_9ARAC|nr:hypothetical protein CDAR_61571 [Caerostris darwini]